MYVLFILCEIDFSLYHAFSCKFLKEICNCAKCRDIFAKDLNVTREKCNNFSVITLLISLKVGCSPTECTISKNNE